MSPSPSRVPNPQRAPNDVPLNRAAMIARLRAETFDLAIVGGGINGAAIAREGAMRGLRVALLERDDFAGATSSRSSKLIHGGLRYLPQGHLRLVYEALNERERLRLLTAPHLVHPLRFLMPFFRGRRPGRLAIPLGLALYDLMARTPRAERHHLLSKTRVEQIEPGLSVDRLVGGATYFDSWGDDARLTLENALDAAYHGAAIANGVVIEELTLRRAATSMLAARDRESGEPFAIKARKVVNAAGPWVDWIRRMDNRNCAPLVRLTKGVHLVVAAARLPVRNALVLTERAGRIVFVLPNDGYVLIGTTDTDFRRDAGRAAVDADDIEYLLGVVDEALPDFALTHEDVVASFAGVRALPVGAPGVAPSAVAREEVIEESAAGLLTIAGGKLTTHRAIAERVLDRLSGALGVSRKSSPTRVIPLPGARPRAGGTAELTALPAPVRDQLQRRYGSRASIVARLAGENSQWAAPLVEGASALRAEVIFAARYEMARSVGDFIVRRTAMTWREPHAVREATRMVGRLMAGELGWDAHREELEIERARALANPAPNQ